MSMLLAIFLTETAEPGQGDWINNPMLYLAPKVPYSSLSMWEGA
jgi:hypothetical protein